MTTEVRPKKILLLSTIYPAPDLKYGTSVCHYFTKEWVKMGYEVKVIHYQVVYPYLFYWLAFFFRDKIATKTGGVVNTHRQTKELLYVMDNVEVCRIPIFKWVPMRRFSMRVLKSQFNKLINKNIAADFVPDIVVGHFDNPQLYMVANLKKQYPKATSCIVMHDQGLRIPQMFPTSYRELMDHIDVWGFRSRSQRIGFESSYGKMSHTFMCYSGIPENYIVQQLNGDKYQEGIHNFLYVGELIHRKFPTVLPEALLKAFPDKSFSLTYVGNGAEQGVINDLITKLQLIDNVRFVGRIPREEVTRYFDASDCFIMISENEAFGLVYLEAMARGCITIGARGEGIDGVIIDGQNGFLCEAGNADELTQIIMKINALGPNQRAEISRNAIQTVSKMTDYLVAQNYINELEKNHNYGTTSDY